MNSVAQLHRCSASTRFSATRITHRRARVAVVASSSVPSSVQTDKAASQLAGQLRLRSASCYLPHPEKLATGGEDAHFITNVLGGAIGVADGVGGWREEGVNPAEYSRTLMKIARAHLEQEKVIDPRGAIAVAHAKTKLPGSSTACVVQLDAKARKLVAANLGDSGFVVVRGDKIISRSRALQHHFDCPLQLGAYPEYVEITDTADQADIYNIDVLPGDVLVAGSDGLWDNAYDHEIISAVQTAATSVQEAAGDLAALARKHASDPEFESPYTKEALEAGYDIPWWEKVMNSKIKDGRFQLGRLAGGKQDDITVVIAAVVAA